MMLGPDKHLIQDVESVFSMAGRYPPDSAELETGLGIYVSWVRQRFRLHFT